MLPLLPGFGAHASVSKMAFLSASSKEASESHSVPSLGAAAADEPQRTRCTGPSVMRGGVAGGAFGSAEGLGTACGPSAAEALAEAAVAELFVEGRRER